MARTRHVYVADTRKEVGAMLRLILGDLRLDVITLTQERRMAFTASSLSRKVDREMFVRFEPVGSILGDQLRVIIAYRTLDGLQSGYGLYQEDINLCQPLGPIEVIEKMAPGTRLRIEQRELLGRLIENLSKSRP